MRGKGEKWTLREEGKKSIEWERGRKVKKMVTENKKEGQEW